MRVRATKLGYIGHKRRKEGAEFEIDNESCFSKKWMESLEPSNKKAKHSQEKTQKVDEDII